MTVAQLIAKLSTLPQDATVVLEPSNDQDAPTDVNINHMDAPTSARVWNICEDTVFISTYEL